jgi:hypothetical protein
VFSWRASINDIDAVSARSIYTYGVTEYEDKDKEEAKVDARSIYTYGVTEYEDKDKAEAKE